MRKIHAFALLTILVLTANVVASAQAVRSVLTEKIDDNQLAPLRGNTHPSAILRNDRGPVDPSLPLRRIIMMLKRTPEQELSLQSLIDDLHNAKSPRFHQWLTPRQFGESFGPSESDLNTLVSWLLSKGLTVEKVPSGRSLIIFSGTAGQVSSALHTEIHNYAVGGKMHIANATEPQVPAALAPLIAGFRSLNNFHPHPLSYFAGAYKRDASLRWRHDSSVPGGLPNAIDITSTGTTTEYLVGPADFYTIYNENPLLQQGITGSGQTIAVIEESDINPNDINTFRAEFNLPTYPQTANNTQGGVNYILGPGGCGDPGILTDGDETEAVLDAEWAGAVAPDATIDFVACASTNSTAGVDLSAEYIINDLAASVSAMSFSYGVCEQDLPNYGFGTNSYYSALWQQAAAQGQTVVVASGDSGAAGCDNAEPYALQGLAVSGLASTPYNVAAGGTDFSDTFSGTNSTYWSQTISTTPPFESALSYVPETTWGGYCADPLWLQYLVNNNITAYGTLTTNLALCNNRNVFLHRLTASTGGSGGPSSLYSKPTWQAVYGMPNDGARDIPDISLFAAAGWWSHALAFCESDFVACDYSINAELLAAGGTSFVAPQIAGLMALVNQQTNARQGNANYTLYGLAANEYGTPNNPNTGNLADCNGSAKGNQVGSSCTFYDIYATPNGNRAPVIPSINVACLARPAYGDLPGPNCYPGSGNFGLISTSTTTLQPTWYASPGYDQATGIGSVNITNLVNNWNTLSPGFVTSTALVANPANIDSVSSTTLTATVSENGRGGAVPPLGTVSFYIGSTNGTLLGTAPLAPSANPTNQATGSIVINAGSLQQGQNSLIAYFPGDGANDASSTSTAVTVTVNQASQTITFGSLANQQYGVVPFAVNATASSGLQVTFSVVSGPATVAGNIVTITGAGVVTIEADQAGNSLYQAAPPVQQSFTVVPAVLTVTANNLQSIYGTTFTLTYTITGFVNSDTQSTATTGNPNLTTTATVGSPVGTYPISISQGTLAAANYTFTLTGGTLTIVPRTLTVTVRSQSMFYGSTMPNLNSYVITGFYSGDNQSIVTGSPNITTTAVAGSPVGVYPIVITQGTLAAPNYIFSFSNGTLTITPATLSVRPKSTAVLYGSALPNFAYALTGFVNGDTQAVVSGSPSITTTAVNGSPVGIYPINSGLGTLTAQNYVFTFFTATLAINKAYLTVVPNNLTVAYGQAIPTLTYTFRGFVNGDTAAVVSGAPVLTTTATQNSHPSGYPIHATLGTLSAANYSFGFATGTLTIVRAIPVLSWIPTTTTIAHGTPLGAGVLDATVVGNQPGSFRYTTVVNGNLTTVTVATVLPVGTYTITATFTPADGQDYTTATAQQVITVTP